MRRAFQRIFDFYWGQGIADDVPALTYYLLLSLAPIALGLAAVQALLLKNVLSAIEVADQINRFLPDAVHADITRLVLGTRSNSPQLLAVASAGAPVIGDAADALNLRGSLPGGLLLVVNTAGSIIVFAAIYRWAPASR